jgi:hypothetical protein
MRHTLAHWTHLIVRAGQPVERVRAQLLVGRGYRKGAAARQALEHDRRPEVGSRLELEVNESVAVPGRYASGAVWRGGRAPRAPIAADGLAEDQRVIRRCHLAQLVQPLKAVDEPATAGAVAQLQVGNAWPPRHLFDMLPCPPPTAEPVSPSQISAVGWKSFCAAAHSQRPEHLCLSGRNDGASAHPDRRNGPRPRAHLVEHSRLRARVTPWLGGRHSTRPALRMMCGSYAISGTCPRVEAGAALAVRSETRVRTKKEGRFFGL